MERAGDLPLIKIYSFVDLLKVMRDHVKRFPNEEKESNSSLKVSSKDVLSRISSCLEQVAEEFFRSQRINQV